MGDSWYLAAGAYYVPESELDAHPCRFGDIFAAPRGMTDWLGCQLVHPTCELAKNNVREVQVVRVHSLADAPASQQPAIVAGWEEKDGAIRVAFANTFFLPPVPHRPAIALFADFRDIHLTDRRTLLGTRVAGLTHEARVTLIRRHMYFQYRLAFSYDAVQDWEAVRIASDPAFVGPRPLWSERE